MITPDITYGIVLLCIGLIAGLVGALSGLGGAVIITPVLTILLGLPIQYAAGTALASSIATSSGAAATYIKSKITNIKIGMSLEIATTIGVILGALVAAFAYSNNLSYLIFIIFGIVMLLSVYPTLKRNRAVHRNRPDSTTKFFQLKGSYYDRAERKKIDYVGIRWWLGEIVMFVAGWVSGLLGVGSGVLKVLALDTGMRLPMKVSTATSNFMIGVTAVTGSAIYWALGYIQPIIVAPVIIGVVIGSFFGSMLLERMHSSSIRIIFSAILVIVALEMIVRGVSMI